MALHRQCLQNHCGISKHRGQRSGHTSNLSFILMVIYAKIMAESENPSFGSNILFAKVIKKNSGQQNGQSLTTQNTFLYSSLVIYFRKLFSPRSHQNVSWTLVDLMSHFFLTSMDFWVITRIILKVSLINALLVFRF